MALRWLRTNSVAAAWAAGERRTTFAAFVLVLAFYGVTAAGNLSETDDAYAFAYFTQTTPLTDVSDPRLMLYHMVLRAAYLGATSLGFTVSGLLLMQAFSAVCAALCLVLLPRLMSRGFGVPPLAAVVTALALGVTYGFWRYAVEADVYVSAALVIVVVLHLLLKADDKPGARWPAVVPAAIGAGLAVLFYQPNVIPLFFAFPLLLLRRGRLLWFFAYGAIGVAVVAVGYVVGFLVSQNEPLNTAAMIAFLSQRTEEFVIAPLSLRVFAVSLVKAGFAFGHDLVSASWLFGWDTVVAWVHRVYPTHVIAEEVFTARQAGRLILVPLVVLPVLVAVAGAVVAMSRRGFVARLRNRRVVVCLAWFGLYAIVVGRLNPASIEAWIMALLPLFLILGAVVIAPVLESPQGGRLLAALVVLLAVHNWFGGMALVRDPANEYDMVKGAWVVREGTPRDLVIVTDNVGFAETLRYRSRAVVTVIRSSRVADAAQAILAGPTPGEMIFTIGRGFRDKPLGAHLAEAQQKGGRIIVFNEFFTPKAVLLDAGQRRFLDRLRESAVVVYKHPQLGETLVLRPH